MRKLVILMTALSLAAPVLAQPAANLRQLNQERRIDAGVRSGKLTPHEAAALRAQQHSIASQKQRLKARHHGHLTRRDKAAIHARQRAADRRILMNKHNRHHGRNHLKI
jgi:hypothetical protein